MRTLAAFLVLASVLAGCTGAQTAPASTDAFSEGDFQVQIDFDTRNVYYAGDDLRITARAEGNVSFLWDMGDGTELQGATIRHFYLQPGAYDVRVEATRDDGARASAGLQVVIEDLYGGATAPTAPAGPPQSGDDSGIVSVGLVGDEPTAGQDVRLMLTAPAILSGPGTWTVWIGDEAYEQAFDALPDAMEIPMPEAGRQRAVWHATVEGGEYLGNLTFDVWGTPIEFGEPTDDQWLRPGVHSEVCTVNFLFHYKWYRFFIGSAAHCIDDLDINDVCEGEPTGKIGNKETLSAHDATKSTSDAWVGYNSWLTMDQKGGGSCAGNDFALIELGPDAQQHMHPKAMFYGGPTELAPVGGFGSGTTLYGYGASNLHGNVGVGYPGQDAVNSKRGISLGTDNGGYSQHLYFALPGVPGDSGGPAFGPGGEALGAASTITIAPTPTTNRYTVIPKALEYMEEKEGWVPELITWDDWSTTGA